MTRSEMQSTVLLCITLTALALIIPYELSRNTYDSVWEDPTVKNLTQTFNMTSVKANTTAPGNATVFTDGENSLSIESDPFYTKSFWIDLFVYALLCPLSYYWHIYLERYFPTRPRGVEIDYPPHEQAGLLINEGQEEEVVKRWIAQGRVRRSSISWWNTWVKWVLHYTIGNLCSIVAHFWLGGLMRSKSFSKLSGSFRSAIIWSFCTSFLSVAPFTSFIGFAIVPAAKRPVFEAGSNMLESIFLTVFLNVAVPWAIRTDVAQSMMKNITESYHMGKEITKAKARSGNTPLEIGGRLGDEL